MLPAEARKFRWVLKRLGDSLMEDKDLDKKLKDTATCDGFEVLSYSGGGVNSPVLLILKKDGKPVATLPLENSTLRRMKSRMQDWRDYHSGAGKAFRHGNMRCNKR